MSGEYKGVWVFLERRGKEVLEPSLEVLGKARELADKYGDTVAGVLMGSDDMELLVETAIHHGADMVYLVENPVLEEYSTLPYTEALARLITKYKPNILLYPATRNGRDLAGRISAKLGLGLSANIIWADIAEGGVLLGGVPGFGGGIMAVTKCLSRPQMATVRPGAFPKPEPDASRTGKVEKVDVGELPGPGVKVVERKVYEVEDISKAEAIVIAGMGVKERLKLAKKLAERLGWAFGVTRPVSDEGLASRDIFVGATGKTVRPKIALVIGASGAAHFVSGITDAEKVIAINIDPEAPIFTYSDYFVVGDAYKILPKLLEKLGVKP